MIIDWEALHDAEERREAEEAEARSAYYASLEERQQKHDEELAGLLSDLGERVMKEEKARMEQEQAEEERKALEAVRAKYRKANGAQDWTENAEDKAWKAMAENLF